MPLRTLALTVMAIGAVVNTASAQDAPRAGIVMGYPASFGVIWHVAERIAVRPEIGASQSSGLVMGTSIVSAGGTQVTSSISSGNDNWQVSAGVSLLLYLSKHDGLSTYLSPRWAYTRTTSNSSSNQPGSASSSAGNGQFVAASFGAQYAVGTRFSVFGEVGAGYTHITTSPTTSGALVTSSEIRGVSTRSGAGVILYF